MAKFDNLLDNSDAVEVLGMSFANIFNQLKQEKEDHISQINKLQKDLRELNKEQKVLQEINEKYSRQQNAIDRVILANAEEKAKEKFNQMLQQYQRNVGKKDSSIQVDIARNIMLHKTLSYEDQGPGFNQLVLTSKFTQEAPKESQFQNQKSESLRKKYEIMYKLQELNQRLNVGLNLKECYDENEAKQRQRQLAKIMTELRAKTLSPTSYPDGKGVPVIDMSFLKFKHKTAISKKFTSNQLRFLPQHIRRNPIQSSYILKKAELNKSLYDKQKSDPLEVGQILGKKLKTAREYDFDRIPGINQKSNTYRSATSIPQERDSVSFYN